ncbi:hypothetical protein M2360_005113 [Rhizobium sp. SG_E_25_P2]|uniref:hypothetical protein n=1 Tax=Rhizobium sp. SG_E_25_P2 TaxID=2879942 RepID=UPI00247523CE|nr:hypothetical protein [Rhizobium sp. SG_E_25_P2]MDH6269685.1 hypothetical protein [Rhizobium sp. SG_E_25_P2]
MLKESSAEIAIETDDVELVLALQQVAADGNTLTTKREGLDGATLSTVLLTLTPILIVQIVGLLKTREAAKRHVRVIYKGVTIQGVSEETLKKILESQQLK